MESSENKTAQRDSPPYIGFATFLGFFRGLEKAGVPSRIDKSLLRSMSGSNQSAMMSAFRWFKLIGNDGSPSADFEALVSSKDNLAPTIKRMIESSYAFVKDGSINLEKATSSQVQEKFQALGLTGATVVKAMAFFMGACKQAGIPLSPHIKLPQLPRATSGRTKKVKLRDEEGDFEEEQDPPPPPQKSASEALMEKFPAFDPTWSAEIQAKWFEAFGKMQEMMGK
jgi:hypothetical protein